MSHHTLQFTINQAAPGVVFSPTNTPEPVAAGNRAGWSSESYELSDSNRVADLEPDGGHWVGTVNMLPDDIFNISATYFPSKGSIDNIQIVGPIVARHSESALAIVGGGGKYAGARGQARCVVAFSDAGAPLYRYSLEFDV